MSLSADLISQFVKITKDDKKTKGETIVYGTTVEYEGTTYVRIDGSDLLTPVSTTAVTKPGERVTVMIKNHTATVTGNISSPAARTGDIKDIADNSADAMNKISEFEIAIAYRMKTEDLEASNAIIDNLKAKLADLGELEAVEAEIEELRSKYASLEHVTSNDVDALNASIENLEAIFGEFTDIETEDLEALNAELTNLKSHNATFVYLSVSVLDAIKASIDALDAEKLSAKDADLAYANIDFSNIGKAAMEYFYAQSGLIENVIVDNGTITGNLIGVTIKGDLFEANTIVADKLVMLGEDGLYYKLNFSGETVSSEQTDYNSLNGRVITAKSITAEKISVSDLVAFDATIGGFNITENAIFSEVKDSEDNTTRGVYFGADAQVNIGDANNFIKYFKDDEGNYHLSISADTIMYDINGDQHSLADLGLIGEYVKITTYEGEPCIELGETDSEFKVFITNTKILFVEGSGELAYFSNQSLYVKKVVVEEELQQGQFVWKVRANGNLGLMWVGGDD